MVSFLVSVKMIHGMNLNLILLPTNLLSFGETLKS